MLEPYGLNGIRVRVIRLAEIKQELFLRGQASLPIKSASKPEISRTKYRVLALAPNEFSSGVSYLGRNWLRVRSTTQRLGNKAKPFLLCPAAQQRPHLSIDVSVVDIDHSEAYSRLRGHRGGSVHRSVLGALLIGIVNNGLSILTVSIELQLVAKGIIIVLALALDRYLQFEK
jgi:hypothetical protein